MRRLVLALGLGLLAPAAAAQHLLPLQQIGTGYVQPADTLTLTDASGAGEANWPFQFGRPFLDGAVPSGQCPVVTIAGSPVATQADVKNRYADGSAEFAVIAVVVPTIPASGSVTLGFQPGACNNTPLTWAQMMTQLAAVGDATMTLSAPARLTGAILSASDIATLEAKTITDGGFSFESAQVSGVNLSAATTLAAVATAVQAALPSGYTVNVDTDAANGDRFIVQSSTTGTAASMPAIGAPTSGATDLSALMGLAAPMVTQQGGSYSADVATMLAAAACQPWTQGPVAQTMICADDSAAAAYDLALDGAHKQFRPRFYATFWPGTGQVAIRAVGENNETTAIGDLAYTLSLSVGGSTVYTDDLTGDAASERTIQTSSTPTEHWSLSTWSRGPYWLGGTPSQEVDVNENLAYLASTHFIPNYDSSIAVPASAVTALYNCWTAAAEPIFATRAAAGCGPLTPMGAAGAHPEIGPVPTWDVLWLYSGDWRARVAALGITDLSAAFPGTLRETATGHRLSRADAAGSSTGLGQALSITDRTKLLTYDVYDMLNVSGAASAVTVVGPLSQANPWTFDGEHQPPMWFVPYLLTGDPWYLNEAYLWAGFTSAMFDFPRGPGNGDYGVITDASPRGIAWILRNRAEAAFMAPDSDPEKAYFTYLTNDALAEWEGALGVTGTVFDGQAVKTWQAAQGVAQNPANEIPTNDPSYGTQPPLGTMYGLCNAMAATQCSYPATFNNTSNTTEWLVPPPGNGTSAAAGNVNENFMEWYLHYAFGRVGELGFASGPLLARVAPWLVGMINNSGYPCLINMYMTPTEPMGGGFYPTWSAMETAILPAWLTDPATTSGSCAAGFANDLGSEGYPFYASSGLSYETALPGGAQAWSWLYQNAYQPGLAAPNNDASNPKWFILPRTDGNALPAQATATPPG